MKRLSQLILGDEILAQKGLPSDVTVSDFTDDSRRLDANRLFFAIHGSKIDGHAFAATAASVGAFPVVEQQAVFDEISRGILVSSTHRSLALCCSRWFDRPSERLKVVGVTGTNGKTTTTFLLSQIWSALGLVPGVIGTVEYQIANKVYPSRLTTPSAQELQRLFHEMTRSQVSHVAVEVSSIALHQERVAGTRFEVGIFTNLTQDHLDYHGDFENYYAAKFKLFNEYELPFAVINVDSEWGRRLSREASVKSILTFSLEDSSAAFYPRITDFGRAGTRAVCVTPEGEVEFHSPLIGKHNLANVLGVLGASHALGLNLKRVASLLSSIHGAPGRLERVAQSEGRPNIFVDYAHSPDALKNVLSALRELRGEGPGRIITVFGCGGDRDRGKRPLMAIAASEASDVTVATSDNPRTENPQSIIDEIEVGIDKYRTSYFRDADRRSAIYYALSTATPEDLVLIAGKGHETYQIIGTEQFPFDDRQVIRDYYDKST